ERVRTFDDLRRRVRAADEESETLRAAFDEREQHIREARKTLESLRTDAAQLDVARATAESDLSHLASACLESVHASLDDVAAEVAHLEQQGVLASPRPVDDAPDAAEVEEEAQMETAAAAEAPAAPARSMTPDDMVADLRTKIDRMGAVNMMAIEQFDDLES